MNREGIQAWRRYVGEEKANKIASQAAGRGSRLSKKFYCMNYMAWFIRFTS